MPLRFNFIAVFAVVMAILSSLACNNSKMQATNANALMTSAAPNRNTAATPAAAAPADDAARISIADARKAVESGKAVFVDVRDANSYKAGHIKGAINIPLNEVVARVNELPRNKRIITYCS
jgi:3-mercaptopyruvate sulfurtransferase SseA